MEADVDTTRGAERSFTMNEPIRVLHVLGKLNMGGAESRIMDLYRHIDRTRVQFDFLVHAADPKLRPKEDFDDEVRSLGGRIYVLPRFNGRNYLKYRKAVEDFFREHHAFAVVEGHMTSTASIYLPLAKKAGVPVTIAHARSAGIDPGLHGVATRLLRKNLADRADVCLSCSRAASVAVFGQKAVDAGEVRVVPNALDIRSFAYDPGVREKIRKELNIPETAFVIGHVGRFDAVKNQRFTAAIAAALKEKSPSNPFWYVFVGRGSLLPEVQQAFAQEQLQERTVFTGQCDRQKTIALYQAFDCFCFPSLYEGLPGTVVEAQAAGLPSLISDTITDEVCVTDLVSRYSLKDPEAWAEPLLALEKSRKAATYDAGRAEASRRARAALDAAGYDVVTAAVRMQNFYLSEAAE